MFSLHKNFLIYLLFPEYKYFHLTFLLFLPELKGLLPVRIFPGSLFVPLVHHLFLFLHSSSGYVFLLSFVFHLHTHYLLSMSLLLSSFFQMTSSSSPLSGHICILYLILISLLYIFLHLILYRYLLLSHYLLVRRLFLLTVLYLRRFLSDLIHSPFCLLYPIFFRLLLHYDQGF